MSRHDQVFVSLFFTKEIVGNPRESARNVLKIQICAQVEPLPHSTLAPPLSMLWPLWLRGWTQHVYLKMADFAGVEYLGFSNVCEGPTPFSLYVESIAEIYLFFLLLKGYLKVESGGKATEQTKVSLKNIVKRFILIFLYVLT